MAKHMFQLRFIVSILVLGLIGCASTVNVTFIRHGYGQHQELYELGQPEKGDAIRDPKLTDKGKKQARKLGQALSDEHFDLAVTSPMIRTIETATLAFADRDIPIVGLPEVAEFCQTPNCMGTEVEELAHLFTHVDFSTVPASWGKSQPNETPEALEKRIGLFKTWLQTQSGKTVAVVSHGGFLKRLLGINFENCGTVRTIFHSNGEFVLNPN